MTNNIKDIRQQVELILGQFTHPVLQKNLIELNALTHCSLLGNVLYLKLTFPFIWQEGFALLKDFATSKLSTVLQVSHVDWQLHYHIATLKRSNGQPALGGVKNIIVVSSGKGGVGKSSTAVNLALAMANAGANVGLLDADIYGPSIPVMLNTLGQRPTSPDGEHMEPIMAYGIPTNSIGYLADSAMIWRGPMASRALIQLVQDTLWGELDYLIIDMPPGTGDIQLTLAQSIPVTGAVVVTTPQDVALQDAMKGVLMFNKVNVPIIGIVENMSYHICANCGHHEALFGENGAARLAVEHHRPLLGQIPLHISLREDLDKGTPTVTKGMHNELSRPYFVLADKVSTELFWQTKTVPELINVKSII